MKVIKRLIKYLSITAGTMTIILTMAGAFAQNNQAPIQVGDKRPGFELRDLEGQYRHISEWDGKLIVLNFWATWCPPCLHEIPIFSSLHNELSDQGVQFLGIAVDNPRNINRFIKENGMSYPTLYGQQNATILAKIYGNKHGGLPYTVIIGRDGIILATHSGELQRDQLQALLKPAL